jgi:hypothetical protein
MVALVMIGVNLTINTAETVSHRYNIHTRGHPAAGGRDMMVGRNP